jgi:hypothetical protein
VSTRDPRIACEHHRKAEVVEAIAERLRRADRVSEIDGVCAPEGARCEAEDAEHLPKIVEKLDGVLAEPTH